MSLRIISLLKASLIILAIKYIANEQLDMFKCMVIMSLAYIDTVIDKPTYIILERENVDI